VEPASHLALVVEPAALHSAPAELTALLAIEQSDSALAQSRPD